MDGVITLSSDSEKDDSDVEIIGSFGTVKADPLPLTSLPVDDVGVPTLYIDLADQRWTLPELKLKKRPDSSASTLVDLTETDVANGTKQENLSPDVSQLKKDNQPSFKHDWSLQKSTSRDPPGFTPQEDFGNLKPNKRSLDSQTHNQQRTDKAHHSTPVVKLRRLPLVESHAADLGRRSALLSKDYTHMSQHLNKATWQQAINGTLPECTSDLSRATALNGPCMDPSFHESPPKMVESSTRLNPTTSQHLPCPADTPCSEKDGFVATSKELSTREDERDGFCSSVLIPSPTSPPPSQDKAQGSLVFCSKLEQLGLTKEESPQSHLSDHSFPNSHTGGPNPSECFDRDTLSHLSPISQNPISQHGPTLTPEHTLTVADQASNSSDVLHRSVCSEPSPTVSNEDMDRRSEAGTYRDDLSIDSPVSSLWQEGSDGDEVEKEGGFGMDFRVASREDKQFVCPVTLRKIMSGPVQTLLDEEDKGFGTAEVLCRQSLSLVYSTIDENYPEGTLQLLSDLLQPGYYPPRDITSHLLRGILLDPQCPYHLCVQAFNLLMRTQRHHRADKTTVPWDWELLTSVAANQRHPCAVVRMLLDYAVQTLEDDFQAKRSISALHLSIAKATLSCDQQFHRVREVIKWLFSAILKSTEHGESGEAARERDEQIRIVSIFQRMLSLALEVDRSPALNSAKLSQELFHMLISNAPLRAHRMLLLESLQSKLLRCKLLEHLLDYACPLKIPLPMSRGLLLHFLKHCNLAPDPSDGTERWQTWEELVHLLWMLLLSYNKAMKGYLCNSVSEQKGRVENLVYKPDDILSKSAICEAVEAFLSRSQADLGQSLPLHVEESLTYLQDHLLDVCQC